MKTTWTGVVASLILEGAKRLFARLFVVLLFVAIAGPVMAQDGDTIVIPWGQWVVDAITLALPFIIAAIGFFVAWASTFLPPWARLLVGAQLQKQVNEVLEKAVLSAVAQTKGAVIGKTLSVNVSNEVVRKAVEYAVTLAPDLMNQATKASTDALMKMILARMEDLGLSPADLDIDATTKKVKPETFDFGSATAKGLGGK